MWAMDCVGTCDRVAGLLGVQHPRGLKWSDRWRMEGSRTGGQCRWGLSMSGFSKRRVGLV